MPLHSQHERRHMGKRFIIVIAVLFVLTCVFPPWQYTFDGNGAHSRNPAGYFFILTPPSGKNASAYYGVQIDLARLFLHWAALGAVTGAAWLLFGKQRAGRVT